MKLKIISFYFIFVLINGFANATFAYCPHDVTQELIRLKIDTLAHKANYEYGDIKIATLVNGESNETRVFVSYKQSANDDTKLTMTMLGIAHIDDKCIMTEFESLSSEDI